MENPIAELNSVEPMYVVTAICPHCQETDNFNICLRYTQEDVSCFNCGEEYAIEIPRSERVLVVKGK